ncbi:hypothetical protein Gbem_1781 [Citrifermentans bemidjiense Bem]|uniref:PcRGLX/YetA-like N-terminal RIFT barrel domain-containing protein n=1 Tax=Citrifermentans bemidjiense (strain ATCC BAA-1014 / DSM 16622 / JCM 12645 / Bem) TaxID=404380 RepID=B5EA91_CITBB|nr:hypothetical protein [Citrifermentans bemidjiense]ACH38797.1 hypothetical protein Gbem_1781 [Citrifermentans bemidjiense Bem]
MQAKEILVRERAGVARKAEPVRVSVPFAKGELPDLDALCLQDGAGEPVLSQLQVLSRWKDGSVQWLHCDFAADAPASAELRYRLAPGDFAAPEAAGELRVTPGKDSWQVDTGAARFQLDARILRPFLQVQGGEEPASGAGLCRLKNCAGKELQGTVEQIALENFGALRATLRLEGAFAAAARFCCRLHFFAGKSRCRIELTLHNPRRARHAGGLWDLGDPGSLLFRGLRFELPLEQPGEQLVIPEPGAERVMPIRGGSLSLLQQSSGGSSAQGAGYRLLEGGELLLEGKRATPLIWCGVGARGVGALLPRFWQEFPKEVAAGPAALCLSLFPEGLEPHELQGGERSTSSLWLDFCCRPEDMAPLAAPLSLSPAPEAVRASGVLGDLPPVAGDFVDRFLPGPQALFERREAIDEYGWRNFGDIYADHEAVYHHGSDPFVSHYNNQYDVCAGLYRKFLATGDPCWGELASDLARHVLDIDIYHTREDREEYNGGLFWHTDHYISAGNATHRTYSKLHLGVKDPRYWGGGPDAEHCYTTGLLLHYFLTGNPDFRDAVLTLADWCYGALDGSRLLLATAKKSLRYMSLLRYGKGSLFPRYPFDRGTGNALTACLDAFQLSGDRTYLARAEELIRGALHPMDDIEARGLGNPELAWSYTVLLGAVAKFLDKKSELKEWDEAFALARAGLLAYADWMERHEFPYLRKTELLEYPNETWAAQELRKCVVLYRAARYAPQDRRLALLEKARQLLKEARVDLERFPTSNCTRPVALMLQNGWIAAALENELPAHCFGGEPVFTAGAGTPKLSGATVVARIVRELWDAIRETTLKRELAWLRSRL